ncbi:MAG: glycosyltransferase, partial [Bacteroidia bacterium]|nr:glycosyltransferase [Bacteroidia bacterium]
DVLSNYQIFFFPTLHENFGHVISEALIAGCYILLSNHTPWNDLKEFKAGNSISLNDIEMFVKTLQDLLLQDELFWAEQKKQSINYAKSKLNSSEILNLNRQLFLANTTA